MNATNKFVTIWFNTALFVYLIITMIVDVLFSAQAKKVPWDDFYDMFPVVAVIVAALLFVIVIFVGAMLLKHFWNNIISDIFKLREINFAEALAITMVATILA